MRILSLVLAFWLGFAGIARAADTLIVFAAASLTDTLKEVGDAYAAAGKAKPTFSFAASSALARQIESGAPAAIFVSADEQWMDYLADRKLIVGATRTTFLGNTLVLVAPADRTFKINVTYDFPLAAALNGGKLSMANPDSVPAGKYGKAALENLNVWRSVESSVVRGDNVRSALAFVERGEAAAGIVYATDAAITKKVAVVGTFPEVSHPPITYPLAIVAGNDTAQAREFRAFMLSDTAKAIYRKYGFAVK
jgi:molybdate transport system substrate-binding protein